jgi:nucleoid-associated protein YgaU
MPATTWPPIENPANRNIQLGNPATQSPQPNLVAQAPLNNPAFPSGMNSPSVRASSTAPLAALTPPANGSPSPTGSPDVESYDEETYTWRTSDSFRAISQNYYRSDKYERALQLFNQNHPLATDAVRRDPPVVQPGQPVYIPPARILEKYYATAITEVARSAPTTTPENPASSIRPTVNAQPVAPDKRYLVKAGGEMVLDIARRTLGNADRWTDIYRLNPGFDPKDPVPAGTELKMPSDARADLQ